VAAKERLAQSIVVDVLNATHRLIESELRAGNAVIFPSFGKFYPSKRKGGQIKHVKTGKILKYPARSVAAFKAGDVLKRAVAGKRRTPVRSWLMGKITPKP
jgi:nucleoid DNA-binding protein